MRMFPEAISVLLVVHFEDLIFGIGSHQAPTQAQKKPRSRHNSADL